jgi:hypothetical protein
MRDGYLERGDKVRVKLIRIGHPEVEARVVDTDLARLGTMKVRYEGCNVPALYPPIEVLS